MNVCALKKVRELLGGDTFPLCDSASLRLEKFVRIGGDDTKSKEIDIVTGKIAQKAPQNFPTCGKLFSAKLRERLIVDQAGGVLENAGLCLHPHFNAPMIPGSALKGVARHAAWQEWKLETDLPRKRVLAEDIALVFGYPTGDKDGLDKELAKTCKDGNRPATSGKVGFLPAFPDERASLEVDILTPHGGNDWTNPVPCAFPAVRKGASFSFRVVPVFRYFPENERILKLASDWLKIALSTHGVGAKTNAGYGRFLVDGVPSSGDDMLVGLHFASPAFLRGADDSDCSLRISTLRGMLRWWWRWLYRCYLSDKDVRELESKIWGGAGDSPTTSCIALSFASEPKMEALRIRSFDKSAHVANRRNHLSGIAYLSYGMDEKSRGVRKQRRVLEVSPQAKWLLSVALNERKSGLTRQQLAIHAKVAIWALCSFGGIGSRSRKGFGSLCSDVDYDIENLFKDMLESLNGVRYKLLDDANEPYSMLTSLQDSVETNERDAWKVLDRVGVAIQDVASSYKHKEIKAVLGLPRKIHGPSNTPMPHQRGHFHRPPQNLQADSRSIRDRFAAPFAVHLEDTSKGIKINLTAFPSNMVREYADSEQLLQQCIDEVKAAFE